MYAAILIHWCKAVSTGSLGTQKVPAGLELERARSFCEPPERQRANGRLVRESAALSRLSFKYGVSGCSPIYSAGPELEPELFVFVVERRVFCWFGVFIFTGCLVTHVLHICRSDGRLLRDVEGKRFCCLERWIFLLQNISFTGTKNY